MKKVYPIVIIALFMTAGVQAQTQETILTPSKDNSIYSEGELSNGAGQSLFSGVTNNGYKRRALIKFDLTDAVPEGATVDSAHMILTPSKVKTAGRTVNVHMLESDWGEGTSDASAQEGKGAEATNGDATWTKSFLNGDAWVTAGGDFSPDILASDAVTMGTDARFGSPQLTGAVLAWLDDPAVNHGVILLGDEGSSSTTVRFNSKESSDSDKWPKLVLYYQGATSISDSKISAQNMRIYPGPISSDLIIQNDFGPLQGRVELYSITGALVFSGERYLSKGENRVKTGIEKSGIYIYRVISSAGVVSGKFLLQDR